MYITDYFHQLEEILDNCPAIVTKDIFYDQRTSHIGFIKGKLVFVDSSQLHFKEFIDTEMGLSRYKYGYHYQKDNNLIFRYDNYIHSQKSPIHHKHLFSTSELIPVSSVPTLKSVLQEVISLLP